MSTTLDSLPVLDANAFAQRLAELATDRPSVTPLSDLVHRRILVPGLVGGEVQFALVGLLAEALRQRGADVTALLCDSALPVCALQKVDHEDLACTRWCHVNGRRFIEALGLPHCWYSDLVNDDERHDAMQTAAAVTPKSLPALTYRGHELGEHVLRSIEGYFKVGRYDPSDPRMAERCGDFALAAILMTIVSERALDEFDVDKVVMNDGQKIKWGILRHIARQRGLPVEIIRGGARQATVWVEREGVPPAAVRDWSYWRGVPLDDAQTAALSAYMTRRAATPYEGNSLCSWTREQDDASVRSALGLDDRRNGRVFGMFPNLSYDAGKTASQPAFATAAEWVIETVRFFAARPRVTLIIKTNPTEHVRRALDPLGPALAAAIGTLPPNVRLLPAGTDIPAQSLVQQLDVALVYTSTVAIEAAWLGTPIVFVGGGRHGRRGFTHDVGSPQAYFDLLEAMCGETPLTPPDRDAAARYAYMIFFRDLLPLRYTTTHDRRVRALRLQGLADLAPGRDPVIDHLCRGVLCDEAISLEHWPD